jgi:hypothetical protein
MPRQTKKNHVSRGHTRKLSSNNSGYEGNKSNSSNSNASAHSNNSTRGIKNKSRRSLKNFSSNKRHAPQISQTQKYTTNNAYIIASLSSKYNSYQAALKELYRLGNKYDLSQTRMKILKYRLNKMYN